MDLAFLQEYFLPIVVGICLCVGFVIKKWVKDVDNKFIPTIMAVLGVILALWMHEWSFTPVVVLSGLISGLASTGLHQAFTQLINKEDK